MKKSFNKNKIFDLLSLLENLEASDNITFIQIDLTLIVLKSLI